MNVFVTGGTGFVGREVVTQLLAAGHDVRCLVRRRAGSTLPEDKRITLTCGDVTDGATLADALLGCDAVINLVGIIREFPRRGITFTRLHTEATRNLVMAAESQQVSRFIQMSANGTRPDALSAYHQTKWLAEEAVRGAALEWTIFRPSLIFGRDDQFVNLLAGFLHKSPLLPIIGNGEYRLTPVAVSDVAAAFVRALITAESIGQVYHCGGPATFTYNEIVDLVAAALGKSAWKIHLSPALLRPVVALLEGFPQFPLTRTQMIMLLEGNECDPTAWRSAFDLQLTPFGTGICDYLTA